MSTAFMDEDPPPQPDDPKNRFLRNTLQHLRKLQRIVESQEPGCQSPHQDEFDVVITQFDTVHAAMLERGFLPLPK